MLKKLVKVLLVISLLVFFIPVAKDMTIKNRIKSVIKNNNVNSEYSGFIYIPKFDYKNLIKEGDESLDKNLVLLTNFSNNIGSNKIILAGHNNKYVFSKIYNLDLGDEIVISDFYVDYNYKVKERRIIKVDDFSYFNEDGLYLITCTNNNQERFVIKAKREY